MTKKAIIHNTVARWALCSPLLLTLVAADALAAGPSPLPPIHRTPSADTPAPRTPRTPASFTRDMPLSDAIDILRHATSPPLNIVVYWRDLDTNAGIYRDTPIGFDAVSGLRLRQYLEILLNALSATSLARIDYVVDRGVIVIATEDALPKSRHVTRVYDVTELLAPPSRPFFFDVPMFPVMMYGGIPRRPLGTLGPLGAARGRPRSRNVYPRSGLRR